MSLTRIKDSFAIFKNLVLEARARGGSGTAENVAAADPDLHRQIEDLRSCLLQRDTEIAILVNMVKKGKQSGIDSASVSSMVPGSVEDYPSRLTDSESERKMQFIGDNSHQRVQQVETKLEDQKKSNSVLKDDRETRIIKRHLFGVPPPADRAIFEDMSGEMFCFLKLCRRLITCVIQLASSILEKEVI